MSNLLVTGGAGFIGGNFVHYWNERHPDDFVVVLDALTYAGNRESIAGVENIELIIGDIRDFTLVCGLLNERAIDRLVHHSVILELNITSFRLEDAKKSKAATKTVEATTGKHTSSTEK